MPLQTDVPQAYAQEMQESRSTHGKLQQNKEYVEMRTCLKRMFSASAFFFSSAWPFVAPNSRAFITDKTVTVGATVYLAPAPDMVRVFC